MVQKALGLLIITVIRGLGNTKLHCPGAFRGNGTPRGLVGCLFLPGGSGRMLRASQLSRGRAYTVGHPSVSALQSFLGVWSSSHFVLISAARLPGVHYLTDRVSEPLESGRWRLIISYETQPAQAASVNTRGGLRLNFQFYHFHIGRTGFCTPTPDSHGWRHKTVEEHGPPGRLGWPSGRRKG